MKTRREAAVKRKAAEATPLDVYQLAFGRNREAFSRKYAHLDLRELDRLASETALLAASLRALLWERMWSVPTGN